MSEEIRAFLEFYSEKFGKDRVIEECKRYVEDSRWTVKFYKKKKKGKK